MIPASIRNNNPGAMYPGKSAKKFGSRTHEILRSKDGVHKIATFPTSIHGAAAQFDLLHSSYRNMTIEKAIAKWCGGFYVSTYIKVLEGQAGIKRTDILTSEILKKPDAAIPLAKAMAFQEAGKEYPMSDDEWSASHQMAFGGSVAPAFTPENDVPSPKPETRVSETIKTVGKPAAGGALGTVATAFLAWLNGLIADPFAAVNTLAQTQSAAQQTHSFISGPLFYQALGLLVGYTLLCHIVPRIWGPK